MIRSLAAQMDALFQDLAAQVPHKAVPSSPPEETRSPHAASDTPPLPILSPGSTLAQDAAAWVFIAGFAGMVTAWATAVVPAWAGAVLAMSVGSGLITAYGRS